MTDVNNQTSNDNSERGAITRRPRIDNPICSRLPLLMQPQWLQTVREMLECLPTGFVLDEDTLELNIKYGKFQDPPTEALFEAVVAITREFFNCCFYALESRLLVTRMISSPFWNDSNLGVTLLNWTMKLARNVGGHLEVRPHLEAQEPYLLRNRADRHTCGVTCTLTIVTKGVARYRPLIAVVPRDESMKKGLTCVELYALHALAAWRFRARRFVKDETIFQVNIWSTFSYCVQRITAYIPVSYIRTMIEGRRELVGRVEIQRGPWLNFLYEVNQFQILQDMFQCCESALSES